MGIFYKDTDELKTIVESFKIDETFDQQSEGTLLNSTISKIIEQYANTPRGLNSITFPSGKTEKGDVLINGEQLSNYFPLMIGHSFDGASIVNVNVGTYMQNSWRTYSTVQQYFPYRYVVLQLDPNHKIGIIMAEVQAAEAGQNSSTISGTRSYLFPLTFKDIPVVIARGFTASNTATSTNLTLNPNAGYLHVYSITTTQFQLDYQNSQSAKYKGKNLENGSFYVPKRVRYIAIGFLPT